MDVVIQHQVNILLLEEAVDIMRETQHQVLTQQSEVDVVILRQVKLQQSEGDEVTQHQVNILLLEEVVDFMLETQHQVLTQQSEGGEIT